MTGRVLAGVERRASGEDMRGAERLGRSSAAAREKVWKRLRRVGAKWMLDSGGSPLHRAAWENSNPAVVEALINAGADVSDRDDLGRTPLHYAAWQTRTRR